MNIIYKPAPIVLSGNPVNLKIQVNPMAEPGRQTRIRLLFTETEVIADGDYFTLAWGIYQVTITFRDDPDAAAGEFISGTITAAWVENLKTFLQSIFFIDIDFTISIFYDFEIDITAREKGSAYAMMVTDNISPTIMHPLLLTQGTDPVFHKNVQAICRAKHTSGAVIGYESITPPNTGIVKFDMSDYLHTYLAIMRSNFAGFHYPASTTKIFKHAAHVLPFTLEYLVKHDDSPYNFVQKVSGTFRAIMGGLSKDNIHLRNVSFYEDLTTVNHFLTYVSWKRIHRDSPERLYFYNQTAETIVVKAKLQYADAEDQTVTIGAIAATANSIYEIDTCLSYSIVQGDIIRYDVWVENDEGTVRSTVFEYFIDERYYDNQQHFIFRNSYGAYDVVRTTGRITRSPELERDEFTDENDRSYAEKNLATIKHTANTGSIAGAEKRWLMEMALSKEVYWLTGSKAIPVVLTGNRFTPDTDNQRRHFFEFDFKLAYQEEYFTREQSAATASGNENPAIDV